VQRNTIYKICNYFTYFECNHLFKTFSSLNIGFNLIPIRAYVYQEIKKRQLEDEQKQLNKKKEQFDKALEHLSKPKNSNSETKECIVCLDQSIGKAFMPCGHAVCCIDCAEILNTMKNKCPMCRGLIKSTVRIYL